MYDLDEREKRAERATAKLKAVLDHAEVQLEIPDCTCGHRLWVTLIIQDHLILDEEEFTFSNLKVDKAAKIKAEYNALMSEEDST